MLAPAAKKGHVQAAELVPLGAREDASYNRGAVQHGDQIGCYRRIGTQRDGYTARELDWDHDEAVDVHGPGLAESERGCCENFS